MILLVDYHIHLLGHDARVANKENIIQFLEQAKKMGLKEIGFTDHNRYYEQFDFKLIKEVAKDYPEIKVNCGIEMDYNPGEEDQIKEFLARFELDHIIGSIHYLDGWMFDHPKYKAEYDKWDIDKLYEKYYAYIIQSVESGLFDIIGHFDLIKIFNFKPQDSAVKYAIPALEAVAENDLVIEVNTNGLNKPIKEFYPTTEILKEAYQRDVKITLGSDAHHYKRVGENLSVVKEILTEIGYQEIATFEKRERKMVSL